MQLFQGIDQKFEEVFDTDDLYELIVSQKKLNFQPGEAYRYSSGCYAVLAKIVEQISGQSFRAFLEENIFAPLDMNSTLVCDNHNEVIPNQVVSYWHIGNGQFERRSQVFDAYGDGGIITTVQDLAKWDRAFYDDLLGVTDFSEKMYTKATLNNGDTVSYARALNVWEHKGQAFICHNGGMLGFRVDMVRFPQFRTSIILLGNMAFLNPTGDALKIAELLFPDQFEEKSTVNDKAIESTLRLTAEQAKSYAGHYWTDEVNHYKRVVVKNASLFLDNGNPNNGQQLVPIAPNQFAIKNTSILLNFTTDHQQVTIDYGMSKTIYKKYDPTPPRQLTEVEQYSGEYFSDELNTTYRIYLKNSNLFLKINSNDEQQIFPVPSQSRVIWNSKSMFWIGFAEIKFDVDEEGGVQGFKIGDGRVSGIWFEKQ